MKIRSAALPFRSAKTIRRLALAGLALTTAPVFAATFTSTWTGGSANWSSVANWSTPGAPGTFPNNGGSTYDAVLGVNSTVTLDQNITIQKFTMSTGTLAGNFGLTTNELFAWTGGTLAGSGVLNANGGLSFSGSGTKTLNTRTLNNTGAATWTGGTIATTIAAVINNQAGATFDTNFDGSLTFSNGFVSTFNNAGTFTKSAGSGTTSFASIFNNTGTVNVQSGTVALNAGGSATGSFAVSAGAALRLGSGYSLNAGSGVSGAGTVDFGGGTVNVAGTYNLDAVSGASVFSGATVNFNSAITSLGAGPLNINTGAVNFNAATPTFPAVNLSGGTLGGTATLASSGLVAWTGGTLAGSGVLNANGGLSFSGSGTKTLNTRTLNNTGAATWTGGTIATTIAAVINNQAGATFDTNFDGSLTFSNGFVSTFNNAGTFTKSAGSGTTSFASIFNNTGTVNVQSGTVALNGTVTQYSGTTLTAGTWVVRDGATLTFPAGSNILTNNGDATLSGAASVFAKINSLATNNGAFRLLANRSFTAGSFTNTGALQLGGGTFAATTLANSAAGQVFGFGSITVRPTNSGTIRAAGGTLTFSNGILGPGGTVQVDAGAVLDLSGGAGGSSGNSLVHNGTAVGSLNLGTNSFTVAVDYTNAGFGAGNTFDPRANVAGAGQILATGGIAQQLTGDVTGGATATPGLSFGNIHVGDVTTRNYQIGSVSAGTSLRGAIQTSVNGGNLTDARLSGAGVTAANFGPLAPGASSGNFAVTFSGTSTGALTGQTVRLLNNFDNVGDQTLSISGAVYRLANPTTQLPVFVNNRHVGDVSPFVPVFITNLAANDGFSEALDATIGSPTGAVTTNGGSFSLLAPGAFSGALGVGIDTSSVGVKSGTATITFSSNGSGSSALGMTALGTQTVNVTGSVFRFASASAHTPEPVDFGNRHVGAVVTQALTFTNTAANDGFSDMLNAEFGTGPFGPTGDATASGSFSLLAPGATNSSSLVVGINTVTAGSKSGTATVVLISDGTGTSGLGTFGAGVQTVNVTGFVYSGLGIWNVNGNGVWNSTGNWQANGGVPGLDGAFVNTDTATFGSAATSVNPKVTFAGVSPSLRAVTFDNATRRYTLTGSGGDVLKLDSGVSTASVTVVSGSHTINAPVQLHSNLTVDVAAGSALSIDKAVAEAGGAKTLTKNGAGDLTLLGAQNYSSLTATGGNTFINNGAVGSGTSTVTVSGSAALTFGVSQTLAALTIGDGAVVTLGGAAPSAPAPEYDETSLFADAGEPGSLAGDHSQAVPEPGSLSLLAVGALGLLRRHPRVSNFLKIT